jgi:hypothetical protein
VDRERYLLTQNSGVCTAGSHNGNDIHFYGVLKEVIELKYNSNLQSIRTVVLFRCDWYNQEGKTRGLRDDKYFKSIHVGSFWYKSDPYILATQSKKIFYLEDTLLGKDWRVVQKFEHRNMYDVAEKDEASLAVHQDDECSDTEVEVQEGDDIDIGQNTHSGEATIIAGNLQELLKRKKPTTSADDNADSGNEDEDETLEQYASDGGNDNNDELFFDYEDDD